MIDETDALALLSQIWTPNTEWSAIIKQLDQHYLGQLQTD